MPIVAKFDSFCPACRQSVFAGVSITQPLGNGWSDAYLHAGCATQQAPVGFSARYVEIRGLRQEHARGVAMHLGSVVTRAKKYMSHQEVCLRAASTPVSDEKWIAAMSLIGKKAAIPIETIEKHNAESDVVKKAITDADMATIRSVATEAASKLVQSVVQTAAESLTESIPRKMLMDVAAINAATLQEAAKVARAAAEEVVRASMTPREITVKVEGQAPKTIAGRVHAQFERLLTMVGTGVNVWLAGPAGGGKTTAARQVAEALGLPFMFNGAIDSEYKLSGFIDAHGKVVSTAFRRAYSEGGVYLFDEVDASMPSAVLAFNAALSNGHADFPGLDTPVAAHPNFRVIAAGNTWGLGATTEYVGRAKMDAAFLDRFVQLAWGYDEALERALATNVKWCERVQKLRARARERGLKIVISPRATLSGCRLLEVGMAWSDVEEATVRAKISPQDWANLQN